MGFFDSTLGRVALAAGTFGGSEAYRYASKDGNILGKPQTTPTAAPDPGNFQLGNGPGSELSNQLAAQAYGTGLDHQDAQLAREGGFYNQANQNFDIANAAQMRGADQIGSSLADKQRQLAALGGTYGAMGNVNATGDRLTALGTRPMGDSYAEAQMRQGLDTGMAQQLSMARSGRSLGSGQAALNQAAFNNSALTQQTNQAAAGARIQEQNAYNNFQAGALGAAGQQYNAGGALAGQAGNQATTFRTGNENVQLQNAQLGQSQQQINNQTTGIYNSLGSNQQGLGMQANQMGESAFNTGAQRNDNMMGAQLQANMGLSGANTAISMANNQADDAAAAAKQNRTIDAVKTGAGVAMAASDERQKKNIVPLEGGAAIDPSMDIGPATQELPQLNSTPSGMVYATGTPAPQGGNYAGKVDWGKALSGAFSTPETRAAAANKSGTDYLASINAMNAQHAAGRMAPVDVLNRVPGAGAGPSASQASLLSYLQAAQHSQAPQMVNTNLAQAIPNAAPRTLAPAGSVGARVAAATHPYVTSDAHSKTRIQELQSQVTALGGNPTPDKRGGLQKTLGNLGLRGTEYGRNDPRSTLSSFLSGGKPTAMPATRAPDTASLDQAPAASGSAPPAVDLTAAKGYSYEYKDPHAPGAAPGRQVGPMAQDLLQTAAAPAVHNTEHGLQVDTPRLTMTNTAAISELQRKLQQLEAMGGGQAQSAPYQASLYPQTQSPY